jgi:lipoyl-dependent peroxiredoxin
MPDPIQVLYTASATATGGRNGHTQNSDGIVSVDLSIPKAMGGVGRPNTTTPEDLFAAGYAACFGSATEFVARMKKIPVKSIEVQAAVGIGTRPDGGFGLTVKLTVRIPDLPREQAEALVAEAHQVCPYSHATRGNIAVEIAVAD